MKLHRYRAQVWFALLLAAFCGAARAAKPWDKPSSSWSEADIQTILNKSPWAIRSEAEVLDPRDQTDREAVAPPPNTGGSPLAGNNNPGGQPRWDGGVGRNRMGHLATVPVLVRWESAAPVREALKDASPPPDAYVISIAGLVPGGRYHAQGKTEKSSNSDSAVDPRNPEEILEAFMSYSKIRVDKRQELVPQNARLDPETGVIRLYFSRENPIRSDREEAVFTTHLGALNVRVKFAISDMKNHGKLNL